MSALSPSSFFSSKAVAPAAPPPPPPKKEEPAAATVSPVTVLRKKMAQSDRHLVWGQPGKDDQHLPAPILPDDPTEIAALDPADRRFRTKIDGTSRVVIIRQMEKSSRMSPLNPEAVWRLYFDEDGTSSERWTNSLMGWTSNADPYQVSPPITFENAMEAVYFVKKRGWKYVVKHPILRYARRDNAQYQDNFLPQAIASRLQREGTGCDEWRRARAGTSHYFRPLNYHGSGVVPQHGPHGTAATAPHVESCSKLR